MSNKMTLIRPTEITASTWHRLVSKAGLKREDWGEGWLALQRVFSGDGFLTESLAIAVLKRVAEGSKALAQMQALVA